MEIFDEDKAVEFILDKLSKNSSITTKYDADDILEVIDIIWDYYEDNGLLDLNMALDDEEPEEVDKELLISHVVKLVKKDRNTKLKVEDIPAIVEAELEYENEIA